MYDMEKSKTAGFWASYSFPALFFVVCVGFFIVYMNASNCEMFIQDSPWLFPFNWLLHESLKTL